MKERAALGVVAWVLAATVQAQTTGLCDPQIPKSDGTFAYRMRGSDRCEGKFEQPNSVEKGTPNSLSVISFACRMADWKLEGGTKPLVSWQGADGASVQIRVETLPEIELRYRLDAKAAADKSQFEWSADAINALSVKPLELAVLVRGSPKLSGQPSPGTVMLSWLGTSAAKMPCGDAPLLSLRTIQHFAAVQVCVQEYDVNTGELLATEQCRVHTGPFEPASSIGVSLTELATRKGIFRLRLAGQRAGKSPDNPLTIRVSTR